MKREFVKGIKSFPASDPNTIAFTASANLAGVQRPNHRSAVLMLAIGTVSGTPTSFSVNAKVQTSDNGTDYVDYIPPTQSTVQTTAALTAINTNTFSAIDLSGAGPYVRAVIQPTFVGGTTPAVNAILAWTFGDPKYSDQ